MPLLGPLRLSIVQGVYGALKRSSARYSKISGYHGKISCRGFSLNYNQTQAQSSSMNDGYLSKPYYCEEQWNERLQSEILRSVDPNELFYEMDMRYDKVEVMSAIDVDVFVNRISDDELLPEAEEAIYKLRKTPATTDTLPSTGYAFIRALLRYGKKEEIVRILDDRMNYGIFLDFHSANLLMNELLKDGLYAYAAKVSSYLMLQEDFEADSTKLFSLLSCLKYLENMESQSWVVDSEASKEDSEDTERFRVRELRNPYHDLHFDLREPEYIVGKTLLALSECLPVEADHIRASVRLLGSSLFNNWAEVYFALTSSKESAPIAKHVLDEVEKIAKQKVEEAEKNSSKILPRPQLTQFPGSNLDEKDVAAFWESKNLVDEYPELVKVAEYFKSSKDQVAVFDKNLVVETESLLKNLISLSEDKEINKVIEAFKTWDETRNVELEKQKERVRVSTLADKIEETKKELEEKEDVIFFFDKEEEWMMKLPKDEQKGYVLPTEYVPTNQIPFVKTIPPKKDKKKKK